MLHILETFASLFFHLLAELYVIYMEEISHFDTFCIYIYSELNLIEADKYKISLVLNKSISVSS